MTQQEMIDRDLRMLLGDLQVQLIFQRAQIVELQEQAAATAATAAATSVPAAKANGSKQPSADAAT